MRGSAGRRVGYGSPFQFSREYKGFFGSSPAKDVDRLREAPTSGSMRRVKKPWLFELLGLSSSIRGQRQHVKKI